MPERQCAMNSAMGLCIFTLFLLCAISVEGLSKLEKAVEERRREHDLEHFVNYIEKRVNSIDASHQPLPEDKRHWWGKPRGKGWNNGKKKGWFKGEDACEDEPCEHGFCTGRWRGYRCHCFEGWSGRNCDEAVEVDKCEYSMCVYGDCIAGYDGYTCDCQPGWTGKYCEIDIYECGDESCGNGVCIDGINSYSCFCMHGWTGDKCESSMVEETSTEAVTKSPGPRKRCNVTSCVHGVCSDDNECQCDAEWTDDDCGQFAPCVNASQLGQFYFAHSDIHCFIQCDEFGGTHEQCCPGQQVWSQEDFSCITIKDEDKSESAETEEQIDGQSDEIHDLLNEIDQIEQELEKLEQENGGPNKQTDSFEDILDKFEEYIDDMQQEFQESINGSDEIGGYFGEDSLEQEEDHDFYEFGSDSGEENEYRPGSEQQQESGQDWIDELEEYLTEIGEQSEEQTTEDADIEKVIDEIEQVLKKEDNESSVTDELEDTDLEQELEYAKGNKTIDVVNEEIAEIDTEIKIIEEELEHVIDEIATDNETDVEVDVDENGSEIVEEIEEAVAEVEDVTGETKPEEKVDENANIKTGSVPESRCPDESKSKGRLRTFGNLCYQFIYNEMTWDRADETCRIMGGSLVQIRDRKTQDWLFDTLTDDLQWKFNGVWIGATDNDEEGIWMWVTGEQVEWTNWARGNPSWLSGDCANLRLNRGGKWEDKFCDSYFYKYSFICQYDMTPVTTKPTTSLPETTTTPAPEPEPTTTTTATEPEPTTTTTSEPETTTTTTTAHESETTTAVTPIEEANTTTGFVSPCTEKAIADEIFYHPYPGEPTKYIQCDQWGQAIAHTCPRGTVWLQSALTCGRNMVNTKARPPPESRKRLLLKRLLSELNRN